MHFKEVEQLLSWSMNPKPFMSETHTELPIKPISRPGADDVPSEPGYFWARYLRLYSFHTQTDSRLDYKT